MQPQSSGIGLLVSGSAVVVKDGKDILGKSVLV
jgi:hypothetical protein